MSFIYGAVGFIMLPLAILCFIFAIAIGVQNPLAGAISLALMVLVGLWVKSVIREEKS